MIVAIGLVLMGCCRHKEVQQEERPMKVKTMVIEPREASSLSRYVGSIEPASETPLSMQSAGRIVSIEVKNGEHVRAGQKILAIDNTQALNALRSAEASLKHAQDGYNRVKSVHAKGVVSDQKMVEIESQLAQAKSLYAAAKKQVEECTLIAPCEGIVSGLDVQRGQTVIPGARLCTMLDVSGFSVRFSVPEAEVRNLAAAGEVECSAADTVLPITVTERNMTANALTHTYEVTARIQGGAEVLMSGMVGVVRVESKAETQNSKAAIVIPAKCVLLKQEGPTVWVVENGEAVRRSIVSGGYQADGVQVSEGLHPGDTLIIEGYQKLYTGCKVEI